MSRLASVNPETATGKAKDLLDKVQKGLGVTPNIFRSMAVQPAVLDAYLAFSGALGGGTLGPKVREAIALTVGGANGCDYCASAHSAISHGLKVADDEIARQLSAHSADPKLETALTLARKIVARRGLVSEADVQATRDAGYDDGQIGEIVAHVAINLFTNYFNHVNDTEIDFTPVSAQAFKAA